MSLQHMLGLVVLLLAGLFGCAPGEGPSQGAAQDPTPPSEVAGDTEGTLYQVRALVRQVPTRDRPGSQFLVRHEAIDELVGFDGEVSGMDSMTMPFPVASDEVLSGVAPGDLVTLTLQVDWDGDRPIQVLAVNPLPEGTELEFREARPPKGDTP